MKYYHEVCTLLSRLYRPKYNSALLKKAGGSKLMMPIDTPWNTLADSIESYLNNWILIKILSQKYPTLKRSAEDMLKIMKPIAIYLDMIQSDSTKIADVVRIWKDLIDNVTHIIDDDQIITPYHMLMLMMKYLK